MMQFLERLSQTSYATTIRESPWGYPTFETIHLVGVVLLFGSIVLANLRILGLARKLPIAELTRGFLFRVSWCGFVIAAFSGLSLFSAYPVSNAENPVLLAKLALIAVAGLNTLVFQLRLAPSMETWDRSAVPSGARVAALMSIVVWASIVACGRLIAYPHLFMSE